MGSSLTCEVLIIGAGPTGLMAANQLARFGIDFMVVDTKDGPTVQSRAIAVTARSLEIYQQMGLSDYILQEGARINAFNLYSKGKRKAEVRVGEIGKGLTEFHYLLGFEQSKNEELLYQNLKDHGKEVLWETEFLELTEYHDTINAIAQSNGETFNIKAQYLVACDGASSLVRQQLNFSFKGGTYENKFFVADTVMNWDLNYDQLVITPGDKNFCGFIPMKGDKCYRVIGTLPREYFNNEDIAFKDIEEVVIQTLGINVTFEKVNWFSIYKLHHRGVNHFSQDRVFLAGDSAHIHSPAGGQGMNTGLQDAYNLAWKLAFVLRKKATTKLLDTYNEERLPFAKWLLKFTDRGFNMMTSDHWFIKMFRKFILLKLVSQVLGGNRLRQFIFKTISQTGYSYHSMSLSGSNSQQKLQFKAGDRLPYIEENNSTVKFYEQFTVASFHLLHIGHKPLEADIGEKVKRTFTSPIKLVESNLSEHWKKLGVTDELFIMVRPDNYIGYICDTFDEMAIKRYYREYFL